MYVCIYASMYVCMFLCLHVCIYLCARARLYVCAWLTFLDHKEHVTAVYLHVHLKSATHSRDTDGENDKEFLICQAGSLL